MKRLILLLSFIIALITLIGCGKSKEETMDVFHSEESETQTERGIELLKEQYPEYFELSPFKGIEVYVWTTADGTYRCGLMSGTNRMKTAPEIRALEQESLSIAEAKMILEELGVEDDGIAVIPITQPYMNTASATDISEPYIIDEEHAEQISKLFMEK